jgi:hypothetical protein
MTDNLPAIIPLDHVERMAAAAAKSGLFGAKTYDQALALMLVAQAEGLHPMTACQTYDIIQGRPAMKAQAMLARFQQGGGKVDWKERSDARVCATFTHPAGGTVEVDWDTERAKRAGLGGKDTWTKFPRQMLTARVISEGVRTVCPAALGGFYAPEEVAEFGPERARNITPPKPDSALAEQPKRRGRPPKSRLDALEATFAGKPGIDVETGEVLGVEDTPPPSDAEQTQDRRPDLPLVLWPISSDRQEWIDAANKAAPVYKMLSKDERMAWRDLNEEYLDRMMRAHNDLYQWFSEVMAKHDRKLAEKTLE